VTLCTPSSTASPSRYADDCIHATVAANRVYIVATGDRELKRRLRRLPGVPIMYIVNHRVSVERIPEAFGAPRV
jgi:U3 small nucleolar RNA-associated protein 24